VVGKPLLTFELRLDGFSKVSPGTTRRIEIDEAARPVLSFAFGAW
jgi:hypothetical protein